MNNLVQMFAAMDGFAIAGGCEDCDAEQRISVDAGVAVITIAHDDDCPTWRAMRGWR